MIRRATMDDLPALTALAKSEHAASALSVEPFDRQVVQQRFAEAITGFQTAVFVSERGANLDGVIAGVFQPNLHNRFATVFELMWFSTGAAGLRLLDALRSWADRMRATNLVVHNYAGIKSPDTFTRVMRRKGFNVLGTTYTLKLEN